MIAFLTVLALPCTALASEPGNGEFTGAEGPIVGATSGVISAGADVDYYYFYVSMLSDVTIHYRNDSWDYGRRRV